MKYLNRIIILVLALVVSYLSIMYIQIKKDNKHLNEQLIEINSSQSQYVFHAVVISKEKTIKLGEEYYAEIRLAAADLRNPPKVLLGSHDTFPFKPSGDTLYFDEASMACKYTTTPTDTGTYEFGGEVLFIVNGKLQNFPFLMSYKVIQ